MTLVRYQPWTVLRRFHDDINRVFDESEAGANADVSSAVTSAWTPAIDIREEKDSFVLTADVPGVNAKDIEITMENGILTVTGERVAESNGESEGFRRRERVHGTFYRRFTLPDTADAERISAKGVNGVLEIVIPKQEKVRPRRIEVH